ncbi:unnamed protein product [Urochloa decumbens]|uniref:DUF4220 domain-containing protein n=1 Tax=Urochloa decumbens TaxID=240449 RepID=A0ABC9D8I7_9POAL
MWLPRAVDFWNEWAIRIATSASLATHVLLIVLAETRRHSARPELTFALWLTYQVLDTAGSYALAHLSLDTTGPSDKEQIMVAFWAPFLLLHLGGPDNVGAYSLDDDKLSWRKFFGSLWKAIGAVYIVFTKIFLANSGPLSLSSMIMINIGMFRFFEMAVAILRSLRKKAWASSNKNQPPVDFSISHCNEGALKIAQGQWQCCGCRALFDSSVELNSPNLETSRKIFNLGWKDMCKVVEIEASLIYDMLYTKASVVYTIGGYFHRFISPIATSAAIFLFSQYPKNNVERPDLIITYMVLEDILLWHIATAIYLWSGNQQQLIRGANAATTQLKHVKAIEVLSEYLMFLVILRPHMLPDPALGKLCEVTMKALRDESIKDKENNPGCAARKQKLAEILHSKEKSEKLMNSDANRCLVSDAARLAIALQEVKAAQVKDVVELIFDVWVDKLLYAAIRCSRESHARQLGRGGELITIVWIVAEHAGLFRIGETSYKPTKKPPNNDIDDNSEKTFQKARNC